MIPKIHQLPEQFDVVFEPGLVSRFPERERILCFMDDDSKVCYSARVKQNGHWSVKTSYFVGLAWVGTEVIFVEPKMNTELQRTDYLAMLMEAVQHPEISAHCENLFEIRFDQKEIPVSKEKDLLTPLILIQYINVLKRIVQKGLKKSYYPVVRNLNSRVKGKILVGENLRQNVLKHKMLTTTCRFEEFGVNGLENRLLKKALTCAKRYLPSLPDFGSKEGNAKNSKTNLEQLLAYIQPAFADVSEDVQPEALRHSKTNVFYKEYEEGLRLARLILRRFGYQIHSTDNTEKYSVPPYWIDMAKLFELYAFARLKEKYSDSVLTYHPRSKKQELDFTIKGPGGKKVVVDAKYKKVYENGYDVADIRQVSGYARLNGVYDLLGSNRNDQNGTVPIQVLDCLIVYPLRQAEDLPSQVQEPEPINGFVRFEKLGLPLPYQKKRNESVQS